MKLNELQTNNIKNGRNYTCTITNIGIRTRAHARATNHGYNTVSTMVTDLKLYIHTSLTLELQ
jgi:hypothetical protein